GGGEHRDEEVQRGPGELVPDLSGVDREVVVQDGIEQTLKAGPTPRLFGKGQFDDEQAEGSEHDCANHSETLIRL
ncbi:MAG TPA: hypothetical protein PLG60_02505, partial [Acidimicrobiales bacterium]|nr:hypothetical protein [Acidimicrobiales bacterium]